MDEFVFPKRSKKKRKNRHESTPLTFSEKFEREKRAMLEDGSWLTRVQGMIEHAINAKGWSKITKLRCLGLGSPSESRSARLQLAFILEVMIHINLPVKDATFYDPIFSPEDMTGMQNLDLTSISGEEASLARHQCSEPTILFMPHCDIEIYKSVLEANWSAVGLQNLLIIGNPLDQYLLTTEKERLEAEFAAVRAIAQCTHWESRSLPNALCDDKAFIALSVQYLRTDIDNTETPPLFARKGEISDTIDQTSTIL